MSNTTRRKFFTWCAGLVGFATLPRSSDSHSITATMPLREVGLWSRIPHIRASYRWVPDDKKEAGVFYPVGPSTKWPKA